MTENKTRISLFLSLSVGTIIIFAFLWLININEPDNLRIVLNQYLFILCGFSIVAFLIFFLKFDIFNDKGMLERDHILVMVTTILVISQLAFSFANYAYNELNFTFNARKAITKVYYNMSENFDLAEIIDKELGKAKSITLENQKKDLTAEKIENIAITNTNNALSEDVNSIKPDFHLIESVFLQYKSLTKEIGYIAILDKNNTVVVASEENLPKHQIDADPLSYYSFPLDGYELRISISKTHHDSMTHILLLELLAVVAISIFFSIELMIFTLKYWGNKIHPPCMINNKDACQALQYVRQIAFVFYFASRMATTFIPLVAKEFDDTIFGLSGNALASIPLSVETFFTCTSIFFTSMLIEKKGWKLPFLGGLLVVVVGTVLSACSFNIMMFIASRGIVGLGYGFCWMTLRNLSLFGRDYDEKSKGFSLLNAGLYAGMNCGVVFGAILAERIGYANVFLVAAAVTLFCSLFIMKMENVIYVRPKNDKESAEHIQTKKFSKSEKFQLFILASFVLLLIFPSTIASAYLGYYLPLYFNDIGRSISDVGLAQLLYGLLIIYVGPYLATLKDLKKWTSLYSFIIAAAFIGFGLTGGFLPALITVLALGVADSFGFVLQNNYFLKFKILRNFGESLSLSLLSFLKKAGEMLGPLTFAAFMGFGVYGVAILGLIFLVFTLIYVIFFGRRVEMV